MENNTDNITSSFLQSNSVGEFGESPSVTDS